MVVSVAVEKFTVSFDARLVRSVRKHAKSERTSVSGWLADAAEDKLRFRYMEDALAAYERRHGVITDEEMKEVDRVWPASR